MRLVLYYDSDIKPHPRFEFDFSYITWLLRQIERRYRAKICIRDTRQWKEQSRRWLYGRIRKFALQHRVSIRCIYYNRRGDRCYIGREVPVLIVYRRKRIVGVYPHVKSGRLITIRNYLEKLLTK